MSAGPFQTSKAAVRRSNPARETGLARRALIGAAVVLTVLFILVPLVTIFHQAFSKGVANYWATLTEPDTRAAMWLTALTAIVCVPANIAFGICAAWAITKFEFRGKKLLLTLIELPFSISPIVAGVSYILVYGASGLLGPWLEAMNLRIMFAVPGIILVTTFVVSPFVVRELVPLMLVQGSDQEEAGATLGAGGFAIFRRITLPNIRWALIYGTVLCAARAIGEFGAVSVVSGNIRGVTTTLPLHVEVLYQDYNMVGAFAAATTLTVIALVTLVLKALIEMRMARRGRPAH